MSSHAIGTPPVTLRQRLNLPHILLALVLAAVLTACWAAKVWTDLSHVVLPDTDDMMRLAQVRDWIAGQATNDWTQYRVTPPHGTPMHWSRVNDAGLAALILGFTPLVGRHLAEVVAVIGYPALLFAGHLILSGRIATRIWGPQAAVIAILLGSMALPGISVFAPGRIDHHALQVVLIEVAILAAIGRPTLARGIVGGVALALSLAIGLELVLHIAALIAVAGILWIVRGAGERPRLAGLGIGLAVATLPFVLFLRPTLWTAMYCDAFTPASVAATFAGAGVLCVLALSTPKLRSWQVRAGVAAALGAAVLAGVILSYPACLTGPYGTVSPFLMREYMAHIGEAKSVFTQISPAVSVQYGGLMLVGVIGAIWTIFSAPRRWDRWAPLVALILLSGVITLFQVRGTYIGTPLTASLLAGVVLAARRHRPTSVLRLATAWLACSGAVWYFAPPQFQDSATLAEDASRLPWQPAPTAATCDDAITWEGVNRFPPGVVMASVDIAPFLIAATPMSTVGAGYHRNDHGNMEMYRYFLSPPDRAAGIARKWRVRYVAFCPGDFQEMDVARRFPNSLAAMLDAGRAPRDFQPLPLQGTRLRLYRLP